MYKILFTSTIALSSLCLQAQEFLTPTEGFSRSKTAYVTLMDGTEIKGTIRDIDRDKGLIEYIKIEDGSGKNHKLEAEKVKYMYLPPSGLAKLAKAYDFITDAKKWTDQKLNQDLISQGYAYFENSRTKIKKREESLLMQLLNPSFSAAVKVYHDPRAKETTSLGVAGINVAGGIDKSYYIKIVGRDEVAYKMEKGDYKEEFPGLWDKCDAVKTKYGEDIHWRDLAKHVAEYTDKCQ